MMTRSKKFTPEQVVKLLRQIQVSVASEKTTPLVSKEAAITEQIYYRWRKEYGGCRWTSSTAKGVGVGEREAEAVGQ